MEDFLCEGLGEGLGEGMDAVAFFEVLLKLFEIFGILLVQFTAEL